MLIQINRETLLKPLGFVAGIVERRQTSPVLSNILMQLKSDKLTMTGTDLEVEVITRVKIIKGEDGETTIPARKLLDICKSLPNEANISIEAKGDKVIVKSGKSRFSLLTLPTNDFPKLEIGSWEIEIEIQNSALKGLLERTQFCMAQQDVRYYLNGLLLELGNGRLRAVGTDGHRMAISDEPVPALKNEELVAIIVPRKGIQEMIRFLGDSKDRVNIKISKNHIQADIGDLTFTSKLIDGRFPEYEKVLPAKQTKLLKLNKEEFRKAIQRTAILSNEKYKGIRFTLKNGKIILSAHNPEQEEAEEEVAVDYSGEDLEIGFNSSYIVDAVSALSGEQVELGLSDANSSGTMCEPGNKATKYVVMPMRL